jgi:NAD(P)-dependent dehydrogenase (short-subunit alcohol dehydrogenase family)/uncharacterized protein YbbK (DUF523 family)
MTMSETKPPVGVSSCLLGELVRFNGGHSRFRFLTDELDPYVEWVPYCPEMEIGLGTPRETLRLTDDGRLVSKSGLDHTAAMAALPLPAGLDGYVLKAKSPSCGIHGIARYDRSGHPADHRGRGLFAQRLIARYPLLPVEDEGRLNDPVLKEEFSERVFAFARLRILFSSSWQPRDLVSFHARHKLQLLAHDPARYRYAGRIVAAGTANCPGWPIRPTWSRSRPPSGSGTRCPAQRLGQNSSMDLHLNGKVVLITGGTDGLGAALADRLVEEGARVAVCGRDSGRLAAAEQRLRDAGGDALVVQADVTRPADLERFVDAAVARWGRLDGLVNNAGKSAAGRIDQVSDDDWIADLDLKVLAAVRCTRLAVPHLIAAGGGAIVNVLNIGAKAPGAGSLPTTASRAAGLAITKAASKDLGGHGIRVNAVLIGLVESGQWQRRADAAGQSEEELYRQMAKNADIPLGRVGRSAEFADLAAYLLSDRSSYVTGSAVNLDGGSSPVL